MKFLVGSERWLATADASLRVGLLSHQAALFSTGETTAQAFHRYFGERLVALFGPEHGYFGAVAAGERTVTCRHPQWGIPVYSLYGEFRQPTAEMLAGLDVLVVDLQDLGVRCYTYLATLKLVLEACARVHLPCVVCERPIPLPGLHDGPIAKTESFSFVAPCALPLVYGMTQLEVAKYLGLPHVAAPMTPVLQTPWRPQGAPDFLPPSPAIVSWETAWIYPATVFSEAFPALEIGRGTAMAFRTLSAPWLKGGVVAEKLNALQLPGITFHDYTQSEQMGGIRLHVTDPCTYRPWQTTCALLPCLLREGGDKMMAQARPEWLAKLLGDTAIAQQLLAGV